MLTPKVQILVLQYNNSADTVKCLQSLKSLDYPNFAVVIIDNASLTEHRERIKEFLNSTHPEKLRNGAGYSLQTNHSNLGYSGGNNLGIKYALEGGADYVLVLNNDTTVSTDFLTKMIEIGGSDSKIGIVGPALDEGARAVCGGKIEWLKAELHHRDVQTTNYTLLTTRHSLPINSCLIPHMLDKTNYRLQTGVYIPGAAMLIKRKVVEKIGLLDERYFLYFEDADYCLQARRAGYDLAVVPEAVIYHKVSSSTRELGAPTLLYYHYRNALLFNARNGPLWAKLLLPFWSIFIIAKQLIKIVLLPQKRPASEAILRGVMDFYRGRFGPMSES